MPRVDYTYTARGQEDTVTRYADSTGTTSAATSSYGYDDVGQTTGITYRHAASTILAQYGYVYDNAG
jgi:hypothetical protein